ncbi:hypothetical protein R84B8_01113 [Treponema sp. R8-4-B8]
MKKTDYISELTLELYNMGKLTENERKIVEAAILSDSETRNRYEAIKKSDEELSRLYPIENLPRLAAVKDTVIPEFERENKSRGNFRRYWPKTVNYIRKNPMAIGIGIAAVMLIALAFVFYITKWRNVGSQNEPIIVEGTETIDENNYDDIDNQKMVIITTPSNEDKKTNKPVKDNKNNPLENTEGVIIATAPEQNQSGIHSKGVETNKPIEVTGNNTTPENWWQLENQQNDITIPTGITSIKDNEYSSKQLTVVKIPETVTVIGNEAFSNNKLKTVTIPASVNSIGNGSFRNNQLTSIVIPNSVTSIGNNAFANNQLTNITLSHSITSRRQ